MTANVHDVAIMCDFRYPGGTSTAIAEEIRAQAGAGLSTVLVHVPSPYNPGVHPFNQRIVDCLRDGLAELAFADQAVRAKVLVIRQPRIFTQRLKAVPDVRADRTVMVINQAPGDLDNGERYYRYHQVRARIEGYYGTDIEWAPISPLVREQVLRVAPDAALAEQDWHEIIDVAQWWQDRPGPVGDVPVIGRHGRPDAVKWPTDPQEILLAYPDEPDVQVRFLGGGEIAVERVGRRPGSWELLPFGSLSPREFLKSIDFFVYFHDPSLIEAFGRTILEALAAGVPAIIPEHFRSLFGDAALYTTPAGVQDVVRSLHADPARYRQLAVRARDVVEQRYGHTSHVARLAARGVTVPTSVPAPRVEPSARRPAPVVPSGPARPRARVLLVSDNGAGLGHLSRLMAIGRRLPPDLQAVIATQSHGASVAHQEGFLTEYIPSRKLLGMGKQRWNAVLRDRLRHLISVYRPEVVAVDSVPHGGYLDAIRRHPDITWVLIRRAMWKPGVGENWIERGAAFDRILEPGEFAAPADEGLTVRHRDGVHTVDPITFLDPDELLPRDEARARLGLGDQPAVLMQLGAGNINDIASPIARISAALDRRGFRIVLAESAIATGRLRPPPNGHVVKLYPISRYVRGFDLVVSAAGYNSYHELLAFAVPTVFVPTPADLDDQVARARYAAAAGVALTIDDPMGDEAEAVLDRAARPEVRQELARRCAEAVFGNGAAQAAGWFSALCAGGVRVGG